MIQSAYGKTNLETWQSQWLAMFIDGRQFLLAHLADKRKGVYEAVWSANPFIASSFYSYVNSDLHHYSFLPALQKASSVDALENEYNRIQEIFPIAGDLGFSELSTLFPSRKGNEPEDDDAS